MNHYMLRLLIEYAMFSYTLYNWKYGAKKVYLPLINLIFY